MRLVPTLIRLFNNVFFWICFKFIHLDSTALFELKRAEETGNKKYDLI